MLVLLFVVLWFILRGDSFYVLPCVILFFCFSVRLALRILRLGKRQLVLVLFVRLFDLRLFGLVLSVSSSAWCLGRAAVCDCGTPWTFLLFPFLLLLSSTYVLSFFSRYGVISLFRLWSLTIDGGYLVCATPHTDFLPINLRLCRLFCHGL